MAEVTTRLDEMITYLRARAQEVDQADHVEFDFGDDGMTVKISRLERFRRRRESACPPVMD